MAAEDPFADEGPEVDCLVPPVGKPVTGEADDCPPPCDRARRDECRDRRVDGDARCEPALDNFQVARNVAYLKGSGSIGRL